MFFLADTHFCHKGIINFRFKPDGSKFESSEEHDEFVIDTYNSFIDKRDNVYLLGDIAFSQEGLRKVRRLKGNKHLIIGNHDKSFHTCNQYFGSVKAMKVIQADSLQFLATHIPVHPMNLDYRWCGNIHGHTHAINIDDPRYFNVSLENIAFIPIHIDEIVRSVLNA